MAVKGQFREDLLHRLRSVTLHLPPLREREGDVEELAAYFTQRICHRNDMQTKGISPDFLEMLKTYAWPGNVRELQHVLERTIISSKQASVLYPEHLPVEIRAKIARQTFHGLATLPQAGTGAKPFPTLSVFEQQLRQQYLMDLIARACGDYLEACRLSGISKSKLYQLLKVHGLRLRG